MPSPRPVDRDRTYSNRHPIPGDAGLDPRDLRALADLIAANALGEASSASDYDDADGVLRPLELGLQYWRGGRLVALLLGEDRYGSFGYGLSVLPASVGDLDALEELDLHANHLTALPDAIGGLRSLRVLRLQRNALEAIPPSIASLRELRELVVGENALREVTTAIGGLTALEELHLNDNPLAALPEAVGLLPRLRVLNVSHGRDPARPAAPAPLASSESEAPGTRLAALPRSFDVLPALDTLHVAGNRLFCSGGVPDPGLAPVRVRDGSIPRLHGLLVQDCGAELPH